MIPAIRSAFDRGSLILVLGAGCSLKCTNTSHELMPSGPQLAKNLGEHFGVELQESDLMNLPGVAQAVLTLNSKKEVYEYVRDIFKCNSPSDTHTELGKIPLKRIYVINYDDAVEIAYQRGKKQKTSIFRPNDPIEQSSYLYDKIQIIKLHGDTNDPNNDLIFSLDDYANAHASLPRWYEQLAADCYRNTVVFVGSSLNEPVLFDAAKRASANTSVTSVYVITPNISSLDELTLKGRGFQYIQGTFETLIDDLLSHGATEKSAADIARTASPALDALLKSSSLETREATISALAGVTPTHTSETQNSLPTGIRPFYEGSKPQWVDIDHDVTAPLEHDTALLTALKDASKPESEKRVIAVVGAAGTGKTTAMMKAARRVTRDNELPGFWVSNDIADPVETIQHLEKYYEDGYYIFFPSGSDFSTNISHVINHGIVRKGIIVAPYYRNAWKSKFKEAFDSKIVQEVHLGKITEDDATNILEKIEKFGPWTRLAKKKKSDRITTLYERSQKQLLVGLIETTNGTQFPDIIRRDIEALPNDAAKSLTIIAALCTMHRTGVPLPLAIAATRKSHPGSDFGKILLQTEGLCSVENNFVVSRHPVYARTLVERISKKDELYASMLALVTNFDMFGTPVPKHADRATGQLFKSLINYRFIKSIFSRDYLIIDSFYKSLETIFHSDGAFWLQYGLAKRASGDHDAALKLFNRSVDAYANSPATFTHHALGLQHFIIGDRSTNESLAREHMNTAVDILNRLDARDAFDDMYPITTLATGHIKALHKLGDIAQARILARSYFDRISALISSGIGGEKANELKNELAKFSVTGEFDARFWSKPFWNYDS